jgi:hypothetical protein
MFGKILVCVHFVLSLILAAWALALYTNRVNWTTAKGKGLESDGELVALQAEYDKLGKGNVRPADFRWRRGRDLLVYNERRRPVERAWYVQQLEFLRSGGVTADRPIRQLVRDKEGASTFVLDNRKFPVWTGDLLVMEPVLHLSKDKDGKPIPWNLRALNTYAGEYKKAVDEVVAAVKRVKQAADRDLAATNALKGPKGLHARIEFEQVKQKRVDAEYALVRPLWLNTRVELQNLEDLRTRLEKRINELASKGGVDQ